jgi:hypothetical protein
VILHDKNLRSNIPNDTRTKNRFVRNCRNSNEIHFSHRFPIRPTFDGFLNGSTNDLISEFSVCVIATLVHISNRDFCSRILLFKNAFECDRVLCNLEISFPRYELKAGFLRYRSANWRSWKEEWQRALISRDIIHGGG